MTDEIVRLRDRFHDLANRLTVAELKLLAVERKVAEFEARLDVLDAAALVGGARIAEKRREWSLAQKSLGVAVALAALASFVLQFWHGG